MPFPLPMKLGAWGTFHGCSWKYLLTPKRRREVVFLSSSILCITWNFCIILWPKASWIGDHSRHTQSGGVKDDKKEPEWLMRILSYQINQLQIPTSGYLLSIITNILILKSVRFMVICILFINAFKSIYALPH